MTGIVDPVEPPPLPLPDPDPEPAPAPALREEACATELTAATALVVTVDLDPSKQSEA